MKEHFWFENIFAYDNECILNIKFKDAYVLHKIFDFDINRKFFEGSEADNFSKSEKFCLDILVNEGIVKRPYRHGLTSKNECDIIMEEDKRQVEILSEF